MNQMIVKQSPRERDIIHRGQAVQAGLLHSSPDTDWQDHILICNLFVDNLLKVCLLDRVSNTIKICAKDQLVPSDDDTDQVILKMRERWTNERHFMKYRSFLDLGNHSGES